MLKIKTLFKQKSIPLAAALYLLLVSALPLLRLPQASAAANAQLYVTPASQSLQAGANLTLSVVVNTGGANVNGVVTTMTFPANFSYVSLTGDPTALVFLPSTAGNTATFTAAYAPSGGVPGFNGVRIVATLTLHANSAGSGALTFAAICQGTGSSNCSAAADGNTSNQNDLGTLTGGSYTVTSVSTGGGGGGGSGGGTTSSGGKTTSGTTTKTAPISTPATTAPAQTAATPTPVSVAPVAAPKISDITVSNITDSQATITWKTDVAASSLVNYGLNPSYGLSAQTPGLATSHSVTISGAGIVKGATYYFQVASASAGGATTLSAQQKFSTPGFEVTILVVDKHNKPLKGVPVVLGDQTVKTNSQGEAVFQDVAAGKQTVTAKSGGKTVTEDIQVGKFDPATNTYARQKFSLTASAASMTWLYILLAAVVIIAVLIIVRPFPGSGIGGSGPFGHFFHATPPDAPTGMATPIIMGSSGNSPSDRLITPQEALAPKPTVQLVAPGSEPGESTPVVSPSGKTAQENPSQHAHNLHPRGPTPPGTVFSPQGQ